MEGYPQKAFMNFKNIEAMKTTTAATNNTFAVDFNGNDVRFWKATPYALFQKMCDEVFGEGVVKIPRAPMNAVTAPLRFVDQFEEYKCILKDRLERLHEGWTGLTVHAKVMKSVMRLVFPEAGEREYAKLAAWDLLEPWSRFKYGTMLLETDAEKSEELAMMTDLCGYDPEWLAEQTQYLVLKDFAVNAPEDETGVVVLVRTAWMSPKNEAFRYVDEQYFRELARCTFEACKYDDTPMSDIAEDYEGEETVGEVSRRLEGIVIIDELAVENGCVVHAYYNPYNENEDGEEVKDALKDAVEYGDERGDFEDFENEND